MHIYILTNINIDYTHTYVRTYMHACIKPVIHENVSAATGC